MRKLVWMAFVITTCFGGPGQARELHFPYREQGLSQAEASAHLLNRLAYGPRPGEVEAVSQMGLENWVQKQFRASETSPQLDRLLFQLPERSDAYDLRERKLLRAVYSPNQLQEVLTQFWFNHFNVSLTDGQARPFVASYEREAIRANAFGPFRRLLEATSHHPAMLYYLSNAFSTKGKLVRPAATANMDPLHTGIQPVREGAPEMAEMKSGLNENYARELMELHTLGVEGGYRQADVTEVARVFTGWTVQKDGDGTRKDKTGHFYFDPAKHDDGTKRVLFFPIEPNGQLEGEKVLDMLATQNSTARFIARKLAVRFVSDHPSAALIVSMSRAFLRSQGDVREILSVMLESPEFWSRENLTSKVKTPLELEASALRIVGARVAARSQLPGTLVKMGAAYYSCPPPTGFPDRADYWVSPGNLMQRMSFGIELASNRISGVTVNLQGLRPSAANGHKVEDNLPVYAALLMPGRDLQPTDALLKDSVRDPDYGDKISNAVKTSSGRQRLPTPTPQTRVELDQKSLANLVGLLLGCPEFQRR